MSTSQSSSLRFFVPATITKSEKNGKQVMKVSGVASTTAIDSDGEILDPRGFDLSSFNFINWNHSKDPKHYIGEPVKYEITKKGLELEGELFDNNDFAKDVYNLGLSLKNSKKGTKLGWSVEGKVLERDPLDPRKVTKAKITAVAICPFPKNGDTFVDFLKGNISSPEFEEDVIIGDKSTFTITKDGELLKSDTESSSPLVEESLEGVNGKKKKKREQVMLELLNYTDSIEKASQIFSLIQAISDKNNSVMSKTEFSTADIQKAFSTLGLDYDQYKHLDLSKGEDGANGGKTMTYSDALSLAKGLFGEGCPRDEAADKMIEKGCPYSMAKKAIDEAYEEDPGGTEEGDEVEKSITNLNLHVNKLMDSNVTIQKAILSQLEKTQEQLGKLTSEVEELKKSDPSTQFRSLGVRSFIPSGHEVIEKSQDGKTTLSITQHKQRILDVLDNGINYDEIQKSENATLAKSMESFEISNILDRRAVEYLESKNITVTK